jgi:zinc/manganese transport system permease protein
VSLALGVVIVSLRGSNVDLFHILFGSVLALDDATMVLLASVASISLVILAVIWRPLVMECVDPNFLRSVSGAGGPVHLTFLALVVLNLVGAFHALGTLLAVGLMMLPAATARFWARDITALTAIAVTVGMVSGYAGLILSFTTELPSGPAIILVAGGLCLVSILVGPVGGVLRRLIPGRHLEA